MIMQGRAAFFKLSGQMFAIDASVLRQVVTVSQLTPVPRSSSSLLGLFVDRGKILPLFNLYGLFKLSARDHVHDLALHIEENENALAFSIDAMEGFFPYEHESPVSRDYIKADLRYQGQDAYLLNTAQIMQHLMDVTRGAI
jgi:chemotaxis signal transduction protein